jgi:large subunit ribosomal protein L7Ae
MDIPYCFVRGKAALGTLVHQKNAAVVALTDVRKEVRLMVYIRIKVN